jgi:hypothetical protein
MLDAWQQREAPPHFEVNLSLKNGAFAFPVVVIFKYAAAIEALYGKLTNMT